MMSPKSSSFLIKNKTCANWKQKEEQDFPYSGDKNQNNF